MKKLHGCLLALSFLLTACSSINSMEPFDQKQAALLVQQDSNLKPTRQIVAIKLPRLENWQRLDKSLGTFGAPLLLIPENASPEHWQESIQTDISGYADHPTIDARGFALQKIAHAKKQCQVADATLQEYGKDAVYTLRLQHCCNAPDQYQIGKTLAGIDAVYLVYYTAIEGAVSAKRIAQMSAIIRSAHLAKNPHALIRG